LFFKREAKDDQMDEKKTLDMVDIGYLNYHSLQHFATQHEKPGRSRFK
jgi:hypothetical protein